MQVVHKTMHYRRRGTSIPVAVASESAAVNTSPPDVTVPTPFHLSMMSWPRHGPETPASADPMQPAGALNHTAWMVTRTQQIVRTPVQAGIFG